MSVKYVPVQWNRNKWIYDAVMLAGVALFLWIFVELAPGLLSHERPINAPIHNGRAFGACAFVMLTVILCIGPLARLDQRFLPLLYNRRHFGVMTVFVAITHASFIIDWYFNFSPTNKYVAVLSANTDFGQALGFPFEIFGVFALIVLMILSATSHDFWMKFLTPPVWKRLHYLIYPAYAAVVAHVALGVLLDAQNVTFLWIVLIGSLAVATLHLLAAFSETRGSDTRAEGTDWVRICDAHDITEGFAKIARLPGGDRVAVFRQDGLLSAISNACAHQNGPLGEGKVIDCLVTCPWHGFQYDVRNGRSPAPFTEKIPTYDIRLHGSSVMVNPVANPPGTPVDPVPVPQEVLA
ncbi:Rieske 2Fe-2S domain-containing protein [Actibacterium sp. 188UL27-1]|uniref:Rieske 2Fe-2S domain-containing protein n=1 Tax=Actibacterium sp. 188UL27-1 TaxID=2786961 RepID=UPI00195A030E|nr:Rieske 2Fe-2S domain-containing protein [Actibacterium sp. 188UL27-1]MBM7068242.1 ferric reductase-like transmembrane domain-containing protein [Actibacterium sp. 188UL27-1]